MATKVEVFTSPTCPHCPAAVQVVDEAMAVPAIAINNEIQFIGAPSLEELLEKLE